MLANTPQHGAEQAHWRFLPKACIPFCCKVWHLHRMGNADSDPSASVLDLGEDDLPGFSTAFDAVTSGASDGDSDSASDAGHAEQLLYWEVRMRQGSALLYSRTADAAIPHDCSTSAHHRLPTAALPAFAC